MKQPRISAGQVWRNHERRVLRIFEGALELLRAEDNLDVCEDLLNRKLYFCVLKANAKQYRLGKGFDWLPLFDGKNQPDANDKERATREHKRPDFQWGFVDHTEPNPERQGKHYIIECKRLGTPVSKAWVFNRNYVQQGILRFVCAEHGYGKSVSSGAIVGYIRSMLSADILSDVNVHATQARLPSITLSRDGWVDGGVSQLEQELDRPKVPPTPFSLRHLWVDLRQN